MDSIIEMPFETVPPQDTDYSTLGYGITAVNGHASVTFNTPNGRDKERRKYFLITEQVTELFPILNNSGDQSSGYTTTEVTTNIKKLTFTSISGSTPTVTTVLLQRKLLMEIYHHIIFMLKTHH